MIEKPPIGAPCNGCGLCCQVHVCGMGSFLLGLVETYGDRAPGPCPALKQQGDKFVCGVVLRPKDYIASDKSVTALRDAVGLLIGTGAGCDDDGGEHSGAADRQIEELAQAHLRRHGIGAFDRAALMVHGPRLRGNK